MWDFEYSLIDRHEYFKFEESKIWKMEDHVIKYGSVEYEKRAALFCFNGLNK